VHAPFPEVDRLFSKEESERLHSLECGRLALDAAAELDGKTLSMQENDHRNRAGYATFLTLYGMGLEKYALLAIP